MRTRTLLAAVVALLATAVPSALAQKIYWVGFSSIGRANLDGTQAETIAPTAGADPIALDLIHDKLYWWELNGHRLKCASLNGAGVRTVLQGQPVHAMAVDPLNEKLYWSEGAFERRIQRANLDGGEIELLVGDSCCIYWLDLDPQADRLYWGDHIGIWRSALDGGDPELFLSTPVDKLAVDSVNGFIYWSDSHAIWRAGLDGTRVATVVKDVGVPRDIDVDAISGKVYWSTPSAILRAGLDGSDIDVVLNWTHVRGIALDLRECSGHGHRVKGECVCDPNWEGDNCGCFTGGCPNDCSGQGDCLCGVCVCDPSWTGEDCTCSTECPADCSGHGDCECGQCACDAQYAGDDCSCFTGGCPNDCSNHGDCECGQCYCNPGWEGPDCSCEPQKCPNDCSGHGDCVCGACDCNPGWIEADCSVQTQSPSRVFMAPHGLQELAAPMGPTTYLTPAGTTVRMMAWMEDVTSSGGHLNAYQLIWPWDARPLVGAAGSVEYVDHHSGQPIGDSILVDRSRPDWVFADTIPLEVQYNESPDGFFGAGPIFGLFYATLPGTFVNPAELGGIHYLCEFELQISPDASGAFEYRLKLPPDPAPWAALFTTYGGPYAVDEFQPLRLVVGQTQPLTSEPPHQAIDPRQDASGDSASGATLQMAYNGGAAGVTAADFVVEISGGEAPQIADIVVDDNQVTLVFDRAFPGGECTSIRHLASDWHATIRSLPGDVDGDGLTSPGDIITLVDHFNGVHQPPLKTWQCDINLSGQCEPGDILALIDLLNGAGGGKPWNGAEAPQCP